MRKGFFKKYLSTALIILTLVVNVMVLPTIQVKAMTTTNLIGNGDFELDPNSNGTWKTYTDKTKGTPVFNWTSSVYNGASGHSVSIQGTDVYSAFSNGISIQPGNTYSFTAYGKGLNVSSPDDKAGGVVIVTAQIDSNGQVITGTDNYLYQTGTFDWQPAVKNIVAAPDAKSLFIMLILDGSGTVWFDDVSLTNTGTIPLPPSKVTANPGLNKSTYKGFKVTLDGSKSLDTQGSTSLTYNWSIITKPAGSNSVLTNANNVNPSFIPDIAGDYTLALTAQDSFGGSDTKQVTIKAKEFNDISDDNNYNSMLGKNLNPLTGYSVSDFVSLADGWVIVGESAKNQVIIVNSLTGEVAKTYQLSATPENIDFDFNKGIIVATQSATNNIAKIDVNTDAVTYITATSNTIIGGNSDVVFGNDNTVFFLRNKWAGYWIGFIDLAQNAEIGHYNSGSDDIRFITYNKTNNNLILGEGSTSPSSLIRGVYDTQNHSLSITQNIWDMGGNGKNLTISNDGKHIAFSCGGGNGTNGYTIFDIDSSNIANNLGEWKTDAYPTAAAFSYDNKYIMATNSYDIKLFDVNTHALIKNIGAVTPYSNKDISKVAFSRGGKIGYEIDNGVFHPFYIDNTPVTPITVKVATDKISPQNANTSITVTADTYGADNTNLYYHFWINDGNNWTLGQSYSKSNTFNWTPQTNGVYYILVEVRDINSNNGYEAYNLIKYRIADQPVQVTGPVASLEISGGADSVGIPVSGNKTAAYIANVKNQLGQTMANESVTWSVYKEVYNPAGVSIDNSGVLTVGSLAQPGTYIIKAASNSAPSVFAEKSVQLSFNSDTTAPVVSGVSEGATYNTGVCITFDEGNATLDGNAFQCGTTVSTNGSHILVVTDAAGNNTTVHFTINTNSVIVNHGGGVIVGGMGASSSMSNPNFNPTDDGLDVTNINNTDDTAQVEVDMDSIDKVLKVTKEPIFRLNLTKAGTTVKAISTTLPSAAFTNMIEKSIKEIEVETNLANVTVPTDLFDVSDTKNISIKINKVDNSTLNEKQKEIIGDSPAYEFSIDALDQNNLPIGKREFRKLVKVAIPYTLLPGTDPEKLTVYYIDDKGNLENKQGTYNAETKTVSFTTEHFSSYFIKENVVTFSDLKGFEDYATSINVMAAKGIIAGTGNGNFSPADNLNRAEFSKLLVSMLKLDKIKLEVKNTAFKDVQSSDWFFNYTNIAYTTGLIKGYSDTEFAPNDAITYQDLCSIIVRSLKYIGRDVTVESSTNLPYTNKDEIADYAKDSVAYLTNIGVITANSDGTFSASEKVNRAEAAKIMYRLYNYLNK